MSPFYVNKGYHPRLQAHTNLELTQQLALPFIADLDSTHTKLKHAIKESQERYQGLADAHRTPAPKIQISDSVFVLAKFIRLSHPLKKLSEKFLGPFEVIGNPAYSYLISLPDHLCTIHPVFHTFQLEPAPRNTIPN